MIERLGLALTGRAWELVVVDDGSPDGTADIAERLAAAQPVRVVRRAGKAGLASAVIAGFAAAQGDVLLAEHATSGGYTIPVFAPSTAVETEEFVL